MYFFLYIPRVEDVHTKDVPKSPQKRPIAIAAGRSKKEEAWAYKVPNFRMAVSDRPKGACRSKEVNRDKVNTAKAVPKNTRQSILKVQKVFGLDIS